VFATQDSQPRNSTLVWARCWCRDEEERFSAARQTTSTTVAITSERAFPPLSFTYQLSIQISKPTDGISPPRARYGCRRHLFPTARKIQDTKIIALQRSTTPTGTSPRARAMRMGRPYEANGRQSSHGLGWRGY